MTDPTPLPTSQAGAEKPDPLDALMGWLYGCRLDRDDAQMRNDAMVAVANLRSEREALRERVKDLEMMLAALLSRKWSCDEVKGGDRDGSVAFFRFDWDVEDPQPESKEARLAFLNAPRLALDAKGIPILTAAARAALAKEQP